MGYQPRIATKTDGLLALPLPEVVRAGAGVERGPGRAEMVELRRRIGAALAADAHPGGVASTGFAALDTHLPWGGLPVAGLHEAGGLAATAFSVLLVRALLARPGESRPVLWCQSEMSERERGRLHGPGLADLGLDPGRFIFVTPRREREVLWAMEEALVSGAVAVAVAEAGALGMTESRRLQLAAGRGGATGLVLRGPESDRGASAALTRWRVDPAGAPAAGGSPLPLPGPARFDLSLWRCRGGTPGRWSLEQDAETFRFTVAAALVDRPAEAVRAG
ncbi:MAG: hypothetical protein VYB54_08750 [Pseudomonadota bacterium]|nr:hypothetical protein [Pseudomonadota bacterium]